MKRVVELFQIGCRCREGVVTPVKVPCLPLFLRTPELSSMLMKTELLKVSGSGGGPGTESAIFSYSLEESVDI